MSTLALQKTPRCRAFDGLRDIAALLFVSLHVEGRNHITGTRGDLLNFMFLATVIVIASQTFRLIEQPSPMFGRRLLRQDVLKHRALTPAALKASVREVQSEGY